MHYSAKSNVRLRRQAETLPSPATSTHTQPRQTRWPERAEIPLETVKIACRWRFESLIWRGGGRVALLCSVGDAKPRREWVCSCGWWPKCPQLRDSGGVDRDKGWSGSCWREWRSIHPTSRICLGVTEELHVLHGHMALLGRSKRGCVGRRGFPRELLVQMSASDMEFLHWCNSPAAGDEARQEGSGSRQL